jgi:hypothetical protein
MAVVRLAHRSHNRLFGVVPAPNKQLQPTVRHKVPKHERKRAAAELRR